MKIIYSLFCIIFLAGACVETPQKTTPPPPPSPEPIILPADYQNYLLPDKPTSHIDMPKFEEKAALGKTLFFTKINGAACADCHSPAHGFTAGQQQSCGRGCEGTPPNRIPVRGKPDMPPIKSPSSIGVFGSELLLWTGLAGSEKGPWDELLHPAIGQALLATGVKAHDMMVEIDSIKMHHPEIFETFKDIYTDVAESKLCEPIDVAECLAAFQMTLIPNESQFQKWLRNSTDMSQKAKRGVKTFDEKCASCHQPPFLGSDEFMDVGFPHLKNDKHKGNHDVNKGRFLVTKDSQDIGKFRVMRLATNVTTHICWGHGGTFKTIESCINGHNNINLSEKEVDDIVEFLYATTDQNLKDMK